ncbi:hypothetical protein KI387_022970, partial [Taxus chinensis]
VDIKKFILPLFIELPMFPLKPHELCALIHLDFGTIMLREARSQAGFQEVLQELCYVAPSVADEKDLLLTLLGGESCGRCLSYWLGDRSHRTGTASFVLVANLLAVALPLYQKALQGWTREGEMAQSSPLGVRGYLTT